MAYRNIYRAALLSVVALLLCFAAEAQQNGQFRKVTILDSFKLRGVAISHIVTDFDTPSHFNLPTVQAVVDYIADNDIDTIYVLPGAAADPDTICITGPLCAVLPPGLSAAEVAAQVEDSLNVIRDTLSDLRILVESIQDSLLTVPDGSGAAGQVAFWQDANTLTGNNSLFFEVGTGELGIGTVTPDRLLDIELSANSLNGQYITNTNSGSSAGSALGFGSNSGQNVGRIIQNSSANTALSGAGSLNVGTFQDANFGLYRNSAERMRFNSSETLLYSLVEVRNPSGSISYVNITDNTTGSGFSNGLLFGYNGGAIITNREATPLWLGAGDITRMTINSNGNVSIGMGTNPGNTQLEVLTPALGVTPSNSVGLVLSTGTAALSAAPQISNMLRYRGFAYNPVAAASQPVDFREYVLPVQTGGAPLGNLIWQAAINNGSYTNPMTLSNNGALTVSTSVSAQGSGFFAASGAAATPSFSFNSDVTMGMYRSGSNLGFSTVGINRIWIGSDGFVGIGTTSPDYLLHVEASANSSQGAKIRNLSVGGGAYASLVFGNNNSPLLGGIFANSTANTAYGGANSLNFINATANPVTLGTNSAVRLFVAGAGNVGIGTTSPAELLDVNGKTKTSTFQLTTGAASNYILKSDASGNGTWASVSSVVGNTLYTGSGSLTGTTTVTADAGEDLTFALSSTSTNIISKVMTTGQTPTALQIKTGGASVAYGGGQIDFNFNYLGFLTFSTGLIRSYMSSGGAMYLDLLTNDAQVGGTLHVGLRVWQVDSGNAYARISSSYNLPRAAGSAGKVMKWNGVGNDDVTWQDDSDGLISTLPLTGVSIDANDNPLEIINIGSLILGSSASTTLDAVDFVTVNATALIVRNTDNTSIAGSFRLYEGIANGGNFVTWRAPADLTTSPVFVWPGAVGNAQGLMFDNGSGVLGFTNSPQVYTILSNSAAPGLAITNAGTGATVTGYSTENSSVSGRITFTTGTGAMAGGNVINVTFTSITFPQIPIVTIAADGTKDTAGGLAAAALIGAGKIVVIATTTDFTIYIDSSGLANSTTYAINYQISSAN